MSRRDRRGKKESDDNEFGDNEFGDNGLRDSRFGSVPSSGSDPVDEDSIPVNLGAVRADDEFIEALLSQPLVPAQTPADYELAALLSNWRSEIAAEPMPTSPTLEEVEAGIEVQRRADSRRRSLRLVRFTAGAAAAFAILFGGISVVAHSAAPGDALWGVKEVMFGGDASATRAVADVQANIDRAEQAFNSGDKPAATSFLNRAESQLGDVRDSGERKTLQGRIDGLRGKIAASVSSTTTTTTTTETTTDDPGENRAPRPEESTVTVTVPRETITVTTPSESTTSEPEPSTTPSGPTIVSVPPPDLSGPSTGSSSVPLPPAPR